MSRKRPNEFDELSDMLGVKESTKKEKVAREIAMIKNLASNKKVLTTSIVISVLGIRGIIGYLHDIQWLIEQFIK